MVVRQGGLSDSNVGRDLALGFILLGQIIEGKSVAGANHFSGTVKNREILVAAAKEWRQAKQYDGVAQCHREQKCTRDEFLPSAGRKPDHRKHQSRLDSIISPSS